MPVPAQIFLGVVFLVFVVLDIIMLISLLKPGGMMSLCIYSGGDTGFEEKEALFMYLKTLAAQEYTVISNEYMNRGNCPPVPVFVFKR